MDRYEEALERAKAELNADITEGTRNVLLTIFPRLKESEDERIRKELIDYLKSFIPHHDCDLVSKSKVWLAWLEKQGNIDLEFFESGENEKREFVGYGFLKCKGDFLSFKEGETYWLEYIGKDNYNVRSDNLLGQTFHITPQQLYTVFRPTTWLEKQCEQEEPQVYETENGEVITYSESEGYKVVEPKFHEGDSIYQVASANDGSHYEWNDDKHVLKKIADKVEPKFKVGDCIADIYCKGKVIKLTDDSYLLDTGQGIPFSCEHNVHLWTIQDAKDGDVLASKDGKDILIFRRLDSSTCFSSYYNIHGKGELGWSNKCFIPATKEQRDKLEKAMADAGYTFDFEKKELKEIEEKPAWSEEDERKLAESISLIRSNNTGTFYYEKDELSSFLKSLKDRVGCEVN